MCIAEYADAQLMSQIKRLKAHEEFGNIPVILITNEECYDAYSTENENERFIDLILAKTGDLIAHFLRYKDILAHPFPRAFGKYRTCGGGI